MKRSDSNKVKLFTRVLSGVAAVTPYFSIEHVESGVVELGIEIKDSLLREYMSEAMAKGIVHDAGRGWYSRLEKPFALNPKPINPTISRIEKAFPMLTFSCWSTEQINPYMHHLLAKFVTFVFADKDLIPAVYEELQGWKGYRVHLDPSSADAKKFRVDEKTIVIRPEAAQAPKSQNHEAPIEKLLLDLAIEVGELPLMSRGEFQDMAWRVVTSARVSMSTLLRYAQRRRLEPIEVFGKNWPTNVTKG